MIDDYDWSASGMSTEIERLEAEIVKRDARIVELEAKLDRRVEFMRQLALDGAKLDDQIAALKAQPLSLTMELETEGWWNESHDVYTWPIRIGNWGGRVECHGNTPEEARQLALSVVCAQAQQPSVGVVLPERKCEEKTKDNTWYEVKMAVAHNACLDEVARLNPCRAQAVPEGYVLVPVEPTLEMMKASKRELEKSPVIWCRYKAAYRAMLAAAPSAKQQGGEAVAEVLSNRIGNDTATIDKALWPGTKLYTAPPTSAAAVSVAPGLERAIQIVREVAKTQPGYSDEREAIFEALSEAYVKAMAPPCASAAMMSVPIGLLRNICSMVPEKMKPARKELRALLAQAQEVKP